MKKPIKTKAAETPEQKIDSEPFDYAKAKEDFKASNPDLPWYEYPWASELERHCGRVGAGLAFLIKTALADDENYDAILARRFLADTTRFMFKDVKTDSLSDVLKTVLKHGEKDRKGRTIFEQQLAKTTHGRGPKHDRDDFAWVVIELNFILSMMAHYVNEAWEMEWKEKLSNKLIMRVIAGTLETMDGEAHYKAALTHLVNGVFPDSAWGGNDPPPGCGFRWHLLSLPAQEGRGIVFNTLLNYLKAEWPNHAKKKADKDKLKAMLKSALRTWPEPDLHGLRDVNEAQRLEITRLNTSKVKS